ncbi:UNVERIFIED_CONTAM: Nodulation receptor kinase [Sesamum indicum]
MANLITWMLRSKVTDKGRDGFQTRMNIYKASVVPTSKVKLENESTSSSSPCLFVSDARLSEGNSRSSLRQSQQKNIRMMEGLDNVNTRLISCGIIFIFLFIQSNFAQEESISIQCCADATFKEPHTNISYISDESWYPDKRSCQDTVWSGHDNLNKARFFNGGYSSKWCYSLPTRSGVAYLIRGTFPINNLEASPPDIFFNVSVGVTEIERVNSIGKPRVEGIFRATSNYTNFCLVKGKGAAYLSKLELRSSHPDYVKRNPSSVLKLVDRADTGNLGSEIRYPVDPYDRIWRSDSYPDSTANYISSSTTYVNLTGVNSILPPLEVLQTALTHPERLEFQYKNLDAGTYNYNLYLHFLELDDSVQAGQRVFDVYINNEKRQAVDILSGGSRYSSVALDFTTNGVLNLTLVKALNSQFGPICNAYEILQDYPRNAETDLDEVDAIAKVKNELFTHNENSELLKAWSGDPCLPLPWHGLTCEPLNSASVITKMDLSLSRLAGPLPPSITELIYLKELYGSAFLIELEQQWVQRHSTSVPSFIHVDLTNLLSFRKLRFKHERSSFLPVIKQETSVLPQTTKI